MGRKLVLTGTKLTDLTAPRLADVDQIESAGSLMLLDFTHPAGAAGSGMFATGAPIPNLLAGTATTLTGSADVGNVYAYTGNYGAQLTAGTHKAERTGRGGLHLITSHTIGAYARGDGAKINAGAGIRKYMAVNDTHDYYTSTWMRITRPPKPYMDSIYMEAGNSSNSFMHGVFRHTTGYNVGTGGTILGKNPSSGAVPSGAPVRISGAGRGADTTLATYAQVGPAWAPATGTYNHSNATWTDNAAFASWALYRYYIEDLTVSGRTYAQVDAIDSTLYTQEVTTDGGRYYGDTFTNPATIA